MKNDFVGFVERQLLLDPKPIVWCGDYADEEPNTNENLYSMCETLRVAKLTHDEDVKDKYSHNFKFQLPKRFKYLVNYDKKEFVYKSKLLSNDGWQIHPLPLLTCNSNGRGGGDFHGEDKNKLIGRWVKDTIGVVSKVSEIPKDFKEVIFDLSE
jgi:hypothetical protein